MLVAQRRTTLIANRIVASPTISATSRGSASMSSATIASSTTFWIRPAIASVRPVTRNAHRTASATKRPCSRQSRESLRTVGQNGWSGGSTSGATPPQRTSGGDGGRLPSAARRGHQPLPISVTRKTAACKPLPPFHPHRRDGSFLPCRDRGVQPRNASAYVGKRVSGRSTRRSGRGTRPPARSPCRARRSPRGRTACPRCGGAPRWPRRSGGRGGRRGRS